MKVRYEMQTKTFTDLLNLYKSKHLDLEPAFQRDSVWNDRDRGKLIDSMLRGYPLPAIFLHKQPRDGEMRYAVIDGKQRIESFLRFCGAMRGRFKADVQLPDTEVRETVDWAKLRRRNLQYLMTDYKLQVIEVEGGLAEVIDLFVRINSTGKALSAQERRQSKYYQSHFLVRAGKLANKLAKRLIKVKVVSSGQVARKKHIELVCELMISALQQGVIHKKHALNAVMESKTLTMQQVAKAEKATLASINRALKILPNLRQTRFRQLADFYSLVVLIQRFEREGLALADRRRVRLAHDLLIKFAKGVDTAQEKQKRLKGLSVAEQPYGQYLLTVKEGTDALANRKAREEILDGLLRPLFETKDARRVFSALQRRILWNTAEARQCATCHKKLTWDDFTMDHIQPHSTGGRTNLRNAGLLCRRHNSKKGNRS